MLKILCNIDEIQFYVHHYFRFGRKNTTALRQARNGTAKATQTTGTTARAINVCENSE